MSALPQTPLGASSPPRGTSPTPRTWRRRREDRFGDYVQVFRLGGASFECADDEELNTWHERLNVLWRNIASPQVALWTHVIRRRESDRSRRRRAGPGSPTRSSASTASGSRSETLMVNELYLTHRLPADRGSRDRLASQAPQALGQRRASRFELADALEACEKLRETVRASLARYEPEVARHLHRGRGARTRGRLSSSRTPDQWRDARGAAARARRSTRCSPPRASPLAPRRSSTDCRPAPASGAMLGIKEYPTPTHVGMFDALLSAPFPFVLTQSFAFLTKASGQGLLQRQFNRMVERRRFRRLPGRGAQGCARCPDQQRVRHGRSSLLAPGAGR